MIVSELLRNHCPNIKWLRKAVSCVRIYTLDRHILPSNEIELGESCWEERKRIVEKYSQKWSKYLQSTNEKIEHLLQHAPAYQNRADIEKLRIDMLFYRIAYGFLPEEYLCFGLEHKMKEERESYISDIERIRYDCMMSDMADSKVFKDKTNTYSFYKKYYKRDAVSVESEKDYDVFLSFVTKHPIFVQKAVYESCGKGVSLVNMAEESDAKSVFEHLIQSGKHILEERIIQSDALAKLNQSSVNTVRCITMNTKEGIVIPYCFFKVGREGSFVDNGGAGGLLIAIDPETGCFISNGFDEYGCEYVSHPESKIVFKEVRLPDWSEAIELCKEISALMPRVRYIGWDITHTSSGWVIVEGNNCGQMIGPQITLQKGIKNEIQKIMQNMDLVVRM